MKKLVTVSAALLTGLPLVASAAGEGGFFYAGAGVGEASYKSAKFVDCFGQCDTFSDSDIAYNVFVGYQITKAVGVEVAYHDWGTGKDTLDGFTDVKVEPSMFTVMAVGTAPIGANFSVFGKAGVAFLKIDGSEGGSSSATSNSEDLALAGGVQYDIGHFGIRLEAMWVDAEDADKAMMWGASGLFRFGG